jgi:hypothetical protein
VDETDDPDELPPAERDGPLPAVPIVREGTLDGPLPVNPSGSVELGPPKTVKPKPPKSRRKSRSRTKRDKRDQRAKTVTKRKSKKH